jgi:serine phosphatase RsbU (regulator of sigma subunit)
MYFRQDNEQFELRLQEQNARIEEKNREITDSITYARRLQEAILPPAKLLDQLLPGSFVYYKPKDIVAGDFYWVEEMEGRTLFAVADCTGHGVPGAMVSVVCSNALNRAVKEFRLSDPGKILDKVTELVVETFEKSESDVKDGMDISLCSLDKSTNTLSWAGANNPLWIIRKGKLDEVRPDKQPIGKFDRVRPFASHTFHLEKGDRIYIFSDGFADQFGGPKGKKFKYTPLKELLLAGNGHSPKDHKIQLDKTFTGWKGDLEQVDDVCIMGVRL